MNTIHRLFIVDRLLGRVRAPGVPVCPTTTTMMMTYRWQVLASSRWTTVWLLFDQASLGARTTSHDDGGD